MKYSKDYLFKSTEHAYKAGFDTGRNWKRSHIPGGPFAHAVPHDHHDAEWVAFCKFTQDCRTAWMKGWRIGRKRAGGKK